MRLANARLRPEADAATTLENAEKRLFDRTVNGEVVCDLPAALKLADKVGVTKIRFVWAGGWIVLPSSAYQDGEVVYPFGMRAQQNRILHTSVAISFYRSLPLFD